MMEYGGLYADIVGWECYGGIKSYYSDSNSIMVWVSGEIYWLGEAYYLGLLAGNDIQRIADLQNPIGWEDWVFVEHPYPWWGKSPNP